MRKKIKRNTADGKIHGQKTEREQVDSIQVNARTDTLIIDGQTDRQMVDTKIKDGDILILAIFEIQKPYMGSAKSYKADVITKWFLEGLEIPKSHGDMCPQ